MANRDSFISNFKSASTSVGDFFFIRKADMHVSKLLPLSINRSFTIIAEARHQGSFRYESKLIQIIEECVQFYVQRFGQSEKRLQTDLTRPPFQIGDVYFMHAAVLREVNLTPPLGLSELPNTLSDAGANIVCHPAIIELVLALYLAHTLFGWSERNVAKMREL